MYQNSKTGMFKIFFFFFLFIFNPILVSVYAIVVSEVDQANPYGDELIEVCTVNPNIILDIRYATKNNYTGKVLYSAPRCFLRNSVLEKLNRVQKRLEKKGLILKIFDGYRPLSVQKILYKYHPDKKMVADPAKGSNHNRGAAVDVTLVNAETGDELEMPSEFDDFSKKAHRGTHYGVSKEAHKNSKLLEDMMEAEGFKGYKGEWWHFDDIDAKKMPLLDLSFEALDKLTKEKKGGKLPSLESPITMIVNVPVADVLVSYGKVCHEIFFDAEHAPILSKHNGNQITQLLLGEMVSVVGLENGWAAIRATEQSIFNKATNAWEGCPGWVRYDQLLPIPEHYIKKQQLFVRKGWVPVYMEQNSADSLIDICLGTRFMGLKKGEREWEVLLPDGRKGYLSNQDVHVQPQRRIEALFDDPLEEMRFRKSIAKMSLLFLEHPYYIWGGRSLHNAAIPNQYTGSDCSGSIGLIYAAFGIAIPRGSLGQLLKSRKLKKLSPNGIGDLIFLGKSETQIDHVMMYLGKNKFFELTGRVKPGACISSGEKYFGKPILEVKAGDVTRDGRKGYFGSYIRCLK